MLIRLPPPLAVTMATNRFLLAKCPHNCYNGDLIRYPLAIAAAAGLSAGIEI